MSYKIEFKLSVEKDLKQIEGIFHQSIFKKIENLKKFPQTPNIKKLSTVENYYRLRCGNYRIIFQVDSMNMKIVIFYIRHRKDVYKNL